MEEAVLRVNQLDACELDDSLTDILQHQFLQIFKPLGSIRIDECEAELKAVVRLLLWKFSLGTNGCTFGQSMLSLAYAAPPTRQLSSFQRGGLFFSFVVSEWLRDRCDWLVSTYPSLAPLQLLLDRSTTAFKILSLVNFAVFLIQGCYPSLKERVLGLRIVPTRPQSIRDVSHNYMTREILWHGFSEFLFFVLPHFNLVSIWNRMKRLCRVTPPDHSLCAFCEAPPTMPHLSNCGHTYCYYCLAANLKAIANFPCCICSDIVHTHSPASDAIA